MKVKHALILLLAACLAWPHAALAKDFSGLDVVAVVDNSGSMYGSKDHPGANDPEGFRQAGVRQILMELGNDAVRHPVVHRLALVEYGSKASIGLDWVELAHNPKNPQEPLRKADDVARGIISKKMGNTNTAQALALARQLLDRVTKLSPNTGRRQVVCFLVTDGRPYATGVGDGEMWRRIKSVAENLRAKERELWVAGLNDFDNYWNRGDGAKWRELCGEPSHARLADSATGNLPSIFQDIVALWLGHQGHAVTAEHSQFKCPPYQRRLEFNVFYTQGHTTGNQLTVLDPQGRVLPYSSPTSLGSNSPLESHWLDLPPPGNYRVQRKQDAYYSVQAKTMPALATLAAPKRTDLGEPCDLVVKAAYQPGRFLEPLLDYPLKVTVQVDGPAGPTSLEAKPMGQGGFLARWTPGQKGTHHVSALGQARQVSDPSQAWDVFRVEAAAVEVDQRTPLFLRLDHPGGSGFQVLPWGASSDQLRMTLVDRKGRAPEELAPLVENPEGWLQAQRVDNWGKPVGDPVALAQVSPGVYAGNLSFDLDWISGQGWWEPLMVDIRVTPRQLELKDQAYLKGLQTTASSALKIKGDPFTVGSYPVCIPCWLLWGPPALVLLALLFVLVWLLRKVILRRAIKSQDKELGGNKPHLVIFDKASDYAGDRGQSFALDRPRLKLDGRAVEVDLKKEVFQNLEVKRSLKSNQPSVKVKYRWRGRKPWYETTLSMNDRKLLDGLEGKHQWHFLLKAK